MAKSDRKRVKAMVVLGLTVFGVVLLFVIGSFVSVLVSDDAIAQESGVLYLTAAQMNDGSRKGSSSSTTLQERIIVSLGVWNMVNVLNTAAWKLFGSKPEPPPFSFDEMMGARTVPGTYVSLRWEQWFANRAAAALLENAASSSPSPPAAAAAPPLSSSIVDTCSKNILLHFAPWCGMERDQMNKWFLDPEEGLGKPDTLQELRTRSTKVVHSAATSASTISEADRAALQGMRFQEWKSRQIDEETLRVSKGSSLYLRRLKDHYPVLLALRKEALDTQPATSRRPYSAKGELLGFHACMFGSQRNLSQTFDGIRSKLLATKPHRLHIVSSADGAEVNLKEEDRAMTSEQRLVRFVNSFLDIVYDDAASFVMLEADIAVKKGGSLSSRGFLPREVCRFSILHDIDHGLVADLVFIFRPDIFVWNPIFISPYVSHNHLEVSNETSPAVLASLGDDRVTSYHLTAKPMWSLIVDKGFLPTTFGVLNDVNVTNTTIVVSARVTVPFDLHWIGDPMVLGTWNLMNLWMEMYSVYMPAFETIHSGEQHHGNFYRYYMRPLYDFAGFHLSVRPFDFQITLFRSDPATNSMLLKLQPRYAAYQETTIFKKFATKWNWGECMRYYFVPSQFNVSSFYNQELVYFGEIGKTKTIRMPIHACAMVNSPPGLQTCFAQYQRIIFYKKGNNINNPCKPYCGVFPLIFREGLCAHVGNRGPRQRYISTFSVTPMVRNESGEVLRFNLVNPQMVRGDHVWLAKQKDRADRLLRSSGLSGGASSARPLSAPPAAGSEGVAEGSAGAVLQGSRQLMLRSGAAADTEVVPFEESFTRPPQSEVYEPTKKPKRFRYARANR